MPGMACGLRVAQLQQRFLSLDRNVTTIDAGGSVRWINHTPGCFGY
jgi:hypothetical protein